MKIGNILGDIAKVALPLVGTAVGGPIGGMIGNVAADAIDGGKSKSGSSSSPLNLFGDVFEQASPLGDVSKLLGGIL